MEIFGLDDWLAWFLLGMGLLILEVSIAFTFYAAPVALGAFGATLVAIFGDAVVPQLIAFIIGSLLALVALRPIVKQHIFPPDPDNRTNVHVLIGKRAIAVDQVTYDTGTVRVGEEVWSARTEAEDISLEPGDRAEVTAVRGVYAYVKPAPLGAATAEQPQAGEPEEGQQ